MTKLKIAFVPVLHSGYIKFLLDTDAFFVLGQDFLSEQPRLEREIRMLKPEEAVKVISTFNSNVKVLNKINLDDLSIYDEVILPDEDISRDFAEKYLKEKKVTFEKVFLRWDKLISTKELEISPNRKISTEELDRELMNIALKESDKSSDWWRQIGSVVVKDNKVIISGYNKHFPTDFSPYINGDPRNNFDAGIRIDLCTSIHAEASMIATAAKNGIRLDGCDVYVTTFPCPTCARLLAEAGIRKVFYSKGYSLLDAEDILKKAGTEIVLVQ